MPIDAFYAVVGGIGFTLHGLWWVVVQDRPEWSRNRSRRLLAYVVGLHLLIPAMTSVLSLIAPDEPFVWRAAFVTAGIVGILGVVLVLRAIREDLDAPRLARVVQWFVLPVYAVITILAVDPTIPARLGLGLSAIQVEAIVVSILIFFGVEAAWVMMVEPRREADDDPGGRSRSMPPSPASFGAARSTPISAPDDKDEAVATEGDRR